MDNENKPEKEFKAGLISASVWNNKSNANGKNFEYRTVTVVKRYKHSDEWKKTSIMKIDELPKLILLLQQVYETYTLNSAESAE